MDNWELDSNFFSSPNLVLLNDVCQLITDGTHQTPKYFDTGVPFLSATSVTEEFGDLDFSNVMYISNEEHIELKKRVLPQENDLLLSKNGTIGKCKIVPKLDFEFSIYVSLALLRPKVDLIEPKYLLYALRSPVLQSQFLQRTKKDGGVGNLHLVEIRQIKVPLPTLEKQREIIQTINAKMKFLEKLGLMKNEAEKKVNDIKADIWGLEIIET